MNVLIACEESQAICREFRKKGHEAFSCDLYECSGGHPEWHIKQDVLPLLNGNCEFKTMDGESHTITQKWDLIIAHPPCTDLAVSGARHFERKIKDGTQQKAVDFFLKFAEADCDKIAIENPIGIMSTKYRKPDQIIQPYQFGDRFSKSTCLWLKGLPKLIPTNIVDSGEWKEWVDKKGRKKRQPMWFFEALRTAKTKEERSKLRSKTFPGIAKAIVEQWG